MGREKEAPAETSAIENKYVKELLTPLKESRSPAGKKLLGAIGHVPEMEKRPASTVDELKAMRQGLQDLWEQNHLLEAALQKSVRALGVNVTTLQGRLVELEGAVTEDCRNTLAAMKERGIDVLDSVAWFFHVKPGLESLWNTIDGGIKADKRAIFRIEAISTEYHEAGRHLKNIGRILMGKGVVRGAKIAGKLARTMQAPYRTERVRYLTARSSLGKTVSSLGHLEKVVEKQPSILKAMKEHEETPPSKKEEPAPTAAHDER